MGMHLSQPFVPIISLNLLNTPPHIVRKQIQRFNEFPQAAGPWCILSVTTAAGRGCPRPVLGHSIQRLPWLWPWGPSVPADPDIPEPARAQSLRLGRRGERAYGHRPPVDPSSLSPARSLHGPKPRDILLWLALIGVPQAAQEVISEAQP